MLEEILEIVVEKMKKHRSLYEQNEMAVRDQIINPILKGLNWDTESPEDVQPNVSMEEGVPDYTLMKDGNKVLFLEAKKLSVDIEQREVVSQLAKYCFGEGMKYGVLTNGAIWILFRAFQEGTTMLERIIWRVDIETDERPGTIKRLNTISKGSVENIETLITKVRILDQIWQSLVDEPEEMIGGLIPVFDKLIKEEDYSDYEFESSEIKDFLEERIKELITVTGKEEVVDPVIVTGAHPTKMTIDSDTFEIRNLNEILINTAEWLIRKRILKKSDCPVLIGHKRYLINIEPKHRYGGDYKNPKRLSNSLYIEVNYSGPGCKSTARWLLKRFGYSEDLLKVQ